MPYVSSIERIGYEKGRQAGREEGREKWHEEGLRKGLLEAIAMDLDFMFGQPGR